MFSKWKSDKAFRKQVIVVAVLLIFVMNLQPDKQTQSFVPQSTCDSKITENSCDVAGCYWLKEGKTTGATVIKGAAILTVAGVGCKVGAVAGAAGIAGGPAAAVTVPAGCIIGGTVSTLGGLYAGGWIVSLWDAFIGLFTSPCYSCIHDGYLTENPSTCCSGYAHNAEIESVTGISLLNSNNYLCYTPAPEDKCKSWQKPFAGILDSFWKKSGIDSCGTKAYIVMGIGVIAILAVL